jgi:hypothetical protein
MRTPGQADEQAGQGVDQHLPAPHVDPGQRRRFFVAADGVRVAAEHRAVQQDRCETAITARISTAFGRSRPGISRPVEIWL